MVGINFSFPFLVSAPPWQGFFRSLILAFSWLGLSCLTSFSTYTHTLGLFTPYCFVPDESCVLLPPQIHRCVMSDSAMLRGGSGVPPVESEKDFLATFSSCSPPIPWSYYGSRPIYSDCEVYF